MKKKIFIILSVLVFLFISTYSIINILHNTQKEIINNKLEHKDTADDTVIFEAVGHYAFATAGNNNADRGTSRSSYDYKWIQSFPESDKVSYDWETVKAQILEETGLTEITNMSGSYLNLDGEVKKALLSAVISESTGTGYKGRTLFLKPDGTYNIIDFNTNYWMTIIDITDLLVNESKGWYYISYLDANVIPQSGWTIAAVYENSSIETNYIKMLKPNKKIVNGGQYTVKFDSKFKLQNNFQLMGVIMLAGSNGFQILDETLDYSSTDRAFAILDDDTEYQLYDRGDGHFTGRTDYDFANDIFGAQRSHEIQGGELDIFDERLSSDYFGGKNITGYRFIKDGKDQLNISVLGLSQSVVDSNVSVSTSITASTKFKEGSSISVTSDVRNNLKDGYCYTAYNNEITNSVDPALSNITNVKAYINSTTELTATYDESTRKIVVEEIHELNCSDIITISFDATINSNIENTIQNNQYNITSVVTNDYSLIDLTELTGDELTKYSELKATKQATDSVTSPSYLILTVNHYLNGTTTSLADSSTIGLYYGEAYNTTSANVASKYELSTVPTNASGQATISTSINYYYSLKKANVNIRYLEQTTNRELATTESFTLTYDDNYSYAAKDITNYELVSSQNPVTGVVSGNIDITFYYKRKQATLTVNHYIEGTTTKLTDSEISTVYWGDTYTTTPSLNISSNYEYSSISGNNTGTISGNVTITYYYKKKESQLIVRYIEESTNKELVQSQTSTIYYGDTYTTSSSPRIPNNYELLRKTSNYTGVVSTSTIEVIYYYQKKDSSLETSITKNGPEEITKKDESVEYEITYTAKVTDYIGVANITIVDTLPYKIDVELSNLDNGVYDEETNTITWDILWLDIDSFNNKGETTITQNISLVYTDIIPTERIMVNSVKGSITLDNNSRDIESQTSTDIKIPGTIIVHHYEKDTKIELEEDQILTDLVGETTTTSPIKKDGYIVHKPEKEEYTFTEEQQEVIYEYERIKIHISTKVEGTGGTITGEEDVLYGDDSTKDKIVIKPEEGYVLSEVYINGVKIELTEEEKQKLVLHNFTNLKEDMNIVVKFQKDSGTLDNVATGSFANFIMILIIVFLSIIFYLKITGIKLKKI